MAIAILRQLDKIGSDPLDGPKIRLQKILMVRGQVMFIFASLGWGTIYFCFDEWTAGWIPFGYGLITLMSLIGFGLSRRYQLFRSSQLVLTLLLPFFLGLSLGGMHHSSVVILWSLAAPLIALLFDEPKRFPLWFAAFLLLVVTSVLLEPYLRSGNNLPDWMIMVFYVLNIGVVSAIVFLLFYYFMGQVNQLQEKTDNLLLNILPPEIAELLKEKHQVIAKQYQEASILFADIVNFTTISSSLSPENLVVLLNEIFSYIDSLVDQFGLEKIKTIGDCYMVASGVPRSCPEHAQKLVQLALLIQDFAHQRKIQGHQIAFRIGINSGPIVAGVIGQKKFIYDLWGDAVNIASRMESSGMSGMIQITGSTYDLIKEQFHCQARGQVDIKGKGEMETWIVLGSKK